MHVMDEVRFEVSGEARPNSVSSMAKHLNILLTSDDKKW